MDLYIITTLCLFPLVLLTILAGAKVKSAFTKYSKIGYKAGLKGSEVARKLLDDAGLFDVQVVRISGNLTDNYNPKTRVVSLSSSVYDNNSVAAVGIATHEVGHAFQYADDYVLVKARTVLVPACNITSQLALPILFAGLLLEIFLSTNPISNILFFIGVVFYGVYTLLTLITLPVEFNASRRAREVLNADGLLAVEDDKRVKNMLSAAAMTYVMSFALSLVQLLRLLAIFGRGRRRS